MSIVANDLEFRFSTSLSIAGNQLNQSNPAESLGGYLSRTVWTGGALHDLFQVLTGENNRDQVVEYRCLFVINKHVTLSWQSPVLWLPAQVADGANVAIGVDPISASPLAASNLQSRIADSVATPPVGVAFSAPTTKGAGLALGTMLPGHCKAFWVRRTATNSAALSNDGCSIRAEGDTA